MPSEAGKFLENEQESGHSLILPIYSIWDGVVRPHMSEVTEESPDSPSDEKALLNAKKTLAKQRQEEAAQAQAL